MSSSRGGYSGSRGSQSYSISRNGASHSQGRRRSHYRISKNEVDSLPVMLPACGCTLPMKAYIANTDANQGRMFWRCRNWNNKNMCTCNLYIWDDDIIPGVTTMIEVTPAIDRSMDGRENQVCSKCENIDEVMKAFESNEIAKWKTKYGDENKKVKWMSLIMIISWVFFVWFEKF
ncbi:hypothetical protein MtrunA17_Chr8g0335801 [Medicago truncatula]|uniref:Transmembrane protein, putative n=1 Tax=Medicago truncatula TaxID=3880 RepID=A0A072TL38_MEDTR|nr:transmembrane protein, putative [Medicago truncatula]RHN38679.1 hypothetical protein MtrunA17_Chr8g0335801 [Medicago truncatula]